MPRTPRRPQLQAGDVIRTNPFDTFWGAAIVLRSEIRLDDRTTPQCLIGISPLVLRRPTELADVLAHPKEILVYDRRVRTAPHTYGHRLETCIGFWGLRLHPALAILGRVDPNEYFRLPAENKVGDGTNDAWPLYGPLAQHLGSTAIAAWRAIHDAEAQALRNREHEDAFERHETARLKTAREARHRDRGA